jgi:GTP-binding protein
MPIGISAEHKLGFGDLYEKISPFYEKYKKNFDEVKAFKETSFDQEQQPLQIAIIGRPNAGKSTLLNRIIGKERVITGPEAGITRDSIAIDFEFKGKNIRFIDTAGIRRKSNIINKLEKLSSIDSFRALRFAHIAVMMLDANSLIDHQDMALIGEVLKEGRAIIFAINKIDEVKIDKELFLREVRKQISQLFAEVDGACVIGISAKSGYNVNKMLDYVFDTYDQWQSKTPTSKLNEWLKNATSSHSPKMIKGKETKLKYITQIKTRPPTFAVFVNNIKAVEGDYQRYLVNSLRKNFNLNLTPIRLYIRKSENPYEKKK